MRFAPLIWLFFSLSDGFQGPLAPRRPRRREALRASRDLPPAQQVLEVELLRPLGIRVFESQVAFHRTVVITHVGEKAQEEGVLRGDVIVGVSGVFGEDIWNTKGKGLARVQELITYRGAGLPVRLRLERGHPLSEMALEDAAEVDLLRANGETFATLDAETRRFLQDVDGNVVTYLDEIRREVNGEGTEEIFLAAVSEGLDMADSDPEEVKTALDSENPLYETLVAPVNENAARLRDMQDADALEESKAFQAKRAAQQKLPRSSVLVADRQRMLKEAAQGGMGGIKGRAERDLDEDAYDPSVNACAEELAADGWSAVGTLALGGMAVESDAGVTDIDEEEFTEILIGLRSVDEADEGAGNRKGDGDAAHGDAAPGDEVDAGATGAEAEASINGRLDTTSGKELPDNMFDALKKVRDNSW